MRFTVSGTLAILGLTVVAAQDAAVRAGTPGVSHPRLVSAVLPVYPPIAQSARVSGTVIIEAIVDEMGRVADATVTRSIPLLDAAALDAVRQWRFEPPRAGGREVRFATPVTVVFRLLEASAPPPSPGAPRFSAGMPADFAVVVENWCMSRRPTPPLTAATHDLVPVFRELSAAGLLSRTEGLHVWKEPGVADITVSDAGVSSAVAGTLARVDTPGSPPQCELFVRTDGVWRRLWPPLSPKLVPAEYEKQLAPARALIQRMIDGK